jgi:hypothetical protein
MLTYASPRHSQALAAALERAEAEAKQARERAADHERSSSRRARELETQLEVFFLFSFAFVFFGLHCRLVFSCFVPFSQEETGSDMGRTGDARRAACASACRRMLTYADVC